MTPKSTKDRKKEMLIKAGRIGRAVLLIEALEECGFKPMKNNNLKDKIGNIIFDSHIENRCECYCLDMADQLTALFHSEMLGVREMVEKYQFTNVKGIEVNKTQNVIPLEAFREVLRKKLELLK